MSSLEGAFAPIAVQRGTGSYYRGYIKPPERFISTQLSGGLRVLYQKLEEKNKACVRKKLYCSERLQYQKFHYLLEIQIYSSYW
ncbi:unnamed protein product [Pocillopora meandrina]|uniref:Uncharacterized protein n=1 Tax=Pocillopora meandrina TaxID=46732 RepID=A0AAU9WZA9_9CNID|nr:unnamed protein product [Pocillopora meandrina]